MNTNSLDTLLRLGQSSHTDSRPSRTEANRDEFVRFLQQASTPRESTKAGDPAPAAKQEHAGSTPASDEETVPSKNNDSTNSSEDHAAGDPQNQSAPADAAAKDSAQPDAETKDDESASDEVVISAAAVDAAQQAKLQEPAPDTLTETEAAETVVERTAQDPQQHATRHQAAEGEKAVEASTETETATELESQFEQTTDHSAEETSKETAPVVEDVVLEDAVATQEVAITEQARLGRVDGPVEKKSDPSTAKTSATTVNAAASATAEVVPIQFTAAEPTGTQTSTVPTKAEIPTTHRTKPGEKLSASEEKAETLEGETTTVEDTQPEEVIKLPQSDNKSEKSTPTPTASGNDSTSPIAASNGSATTAHNNRLQSLATGETDPIPTENRGRFVGRVASAFRHAQQNDGQIQLRLSPPELGSLKIEISVRNGVLSANLETETTEARRVVLDNLPALRQRLAEQEIRIDKFEVDVRRDGGQPQDQGQWDESRTRHAQRGNTPKRTVLAGNGEILDSRATVAAARLAEGLDVRV